MSDKKKVIIIDDEPDIVTFLTILLEDIMFSVPDMEKSRIRITQKYVREELKDIVKDEDISRYIL